MRPFTRIVLTVASIVLGFHAPTYAQGYEPDTYNAGAEADVAQGGIPVRVARLADFDAC